MGQLTGRGERRLEGDAETAPQNLSWPSHNLPRVVDEMRKHVLTTEDELL
jgi:hypothetical protein